MLILSGLAALAAGLLLVRALAILCRRAAPPRWVDHAAEGGTVLCLTLFTVGGALLLKALLSLETQHFTLIEAALALLLLAGFVLGWRRLRLAPRPQAAAPLQVVPGDAARDEPQPPRPAQGGRRHRRAA